MSLAKVVTADNSWDWTYWDTNTVDEHGGDVSAIEEKDQGKNDLLKGKPEEIHIWPRCNACMVFLVVDFEPVTFYVTTVDSL